jgi:hypothetical protein
LDPCCVVKERTRTDRCVVTAGGVVQERQKTVGRVVDASGVEKERTAYRWPCCRMRWVIRRRCRTRDRSR